MIRSNRIAQGVILEDEAAVMEYLRKHPQLEPFLRELIHRVTTHVPGATEITVQMYEEREISHRYLNVLVRQHESRDLAGKLDRTWEGTYSDMRPDLRNGFVNLMTDFCHPGAT